MSLKNKGIFLFSCSILLLVGFGISQLSKPKTRNQQREERHRLSTNGMVSDPNFKSDTRDHKTRDSMNPMSAYSKRPSGAISVEVLAKMHNDRTLGPKFGLVDNAGHITSQAVNAINLTDSDRIAVQKCYDELQIGMRDVIRKNIEEMSDLEVDGVVEAYRIKPFAPEGEATFDSFLDNLEHAVGPEKAWGLAQSIPVESLAAKFGVFETFIKIIEPSQDIMNNPRISKTDLEKLYVVNVELRDAESGRKTSEQTSYIQNADRNLFNYLSQ